MRRLPNLFLWWNPVERENLMPAHGYPRYPVGALIAALAIGDAARGNVPHAGTVDLVLNARETSVSNRTALRLAEEWRAAGTSVAVHRLRGLGWSHDIIEPERLPAQQALATLVDIIDGDHAPHDREHVIDTT
jgi:alpha-beta hydrolase superfamily lysophospholipase